MIRKKCWLAKKRQEFAKAAAVLAIVMWIGGWFQPALAEAPVVGVNLVNEPYKLSPAEQESLLASMQSVGVRTIRASIPDDANGLAFAQRVYAHGMQIDWLVYPVTRAGTPFPRAPAGFEGMWRSPGLSTSDPVRFRELFTKELADLEDRGIKLAGLEFGNEINWVGSNADFPLPGKGRIFGLQDLYNDPEAKAVAAGFELYLSSLTVLKDVRDHSKLNRTTPIISAGLAVGNAAPGPSWNSSPDGVSIAATLQFLRAKGLDHLVDAYGVHTYPPADRPGVPDAMADRLSRLERIVFPECRARGVGKPCWLTEWGFTVAGNGCPADDATRLKLVQEVRRQLKTFVDQGRLTGLFYYTWEGHAGAPKEDRFSVFLCGAVTPSGRLALAPM
jgi:hypothetical protein